MDGETMQKSFDDILKDGGSTRDFEVTPEEANKFKAALGEPEFQAMLRDYMEEMQDPKQRAEQELYISELESQNRVPEGKDVVHPLPGFVIKTRFTRGSKDAEPEKLFTNVVTSDKLAKPYSKISNSRPGGEAWSLPVAVGPLRKEKDKGGGSTTTFDVCYHPEVLVRADRLSAFRDLVVLSSLERVEDAFLRGTKEKITVDKKYRILKGIKYKSGPCAVMMVAKADINRATESQPIAPPAAAAASAEANTSQRAAGKEIKSKANRPQTSAVTDGNGAAPRSAGAAAEPKKAGDGESPSPASAPVEKEQSTPAEQLAPGLRRGSGGTTYKLVESGAFEMSDHTTDRVRQTPTPRTLVVTVTLPADAESTRKLDVVVALRKLTIGVLGDPEGSSPRYLDLPLPYDVEDDSKCSAARDKSGLLKITMPVKQPAAPSLTVPPPPPAGAAAAARVCSDGSVGGAAADTDIDGDSEEQKETLHDEELKHDITTTKAEQTSASPDTTQQPKPDHSRWVEEAPQSEVLQKPWEALPAPPEKQGDARSLLPNPPLPPPPPLPPGGAETPGVVSQQQHEEEEKEEEGQQEQEKGQEQQQQEKERKETEQQQEQQQQEGEEQQKQQQQEEKKVEQQQQQEEEDEQQQQQQEAEKQQQRRRQQQKEGEEENDLEAQLAEDKDKLFIQSERFIRKVDGYEFKTGGKGCGYYRDDSRKKAPPISWNENIKTVCGVVDVPNIVDASVYYGFTENRMVLSFDAETPGQSDGGGARVDRYRTELVLAGGVAANKCSHDTAEDNLVLKLVKAPEREWGSNPTPTKVTEVASKIDDLLGIAAPAAAGPRETGAAARGGIQEEGPPAPGYEGSPPAQADVLRNLLAYEIE